MASHKSSGADLEHCRRVLIARAELERAAMRGATEDLQNATERIARIATFGIGLVRRYWLPVGILVAGGLFKRTRPVLRMAQIGFAIWQTARLLRNARR